METEARRLNGRQDRRGRLRPSVKPTAFKELDPRCGHSHELAVIGLNVANQAPIVRFFPNGKARARSAPRFQHLWIRSRPLRKPQKQVDNQGLHGRFWHDGFIIAGSGNDGTSQAPSGMVRHKGVEK